MRWIWITSGAVVSTYALIYAVAAAWSVLDGDALGDRNFVGVKTDDFLWHERAAFNVLSYYGSMSIGIALLAAFGCFWATRKLHNVVLYFYLMMATSWASLYVLSSYHVRHIEWLHFADASYSNPVAAFGVDYNTLFVGCFPLLVVVPTFVLAVSLDWRRRA